jgi:hypothetical protein
MYLNEVLSYHSGWDILCEEKRGEWEDIVSLITELSDASLARTASEMSETLPMTLPQ